MNFRPNTLFVGDNLPVLRGMDSECVDLIYLDPPFNSKKQYRGTIGTAAERQSFDDTWRWNDLDERWLGEIDRRNTALSAVIHAARLTQGDGTGAYLAFMGVRLLELHRVLKPTGSIYLHCDDTANAYLRSSMDAVFGRSNYRNEIVWKRSTGSKNDARRFHREHDVVLGFAKGKGATWNPQYRPLPQETADSWYRYKDENGRRYNVDNLMAPGARGYQYEFLGTTRYWRHPEHRMRELLKSGRIIHKTLTPGSRRNVPGYKRYLDESKGAPIGDIWVDVPMLQRKAKERTGWATQKPLALLQRIITASSNVGDLVLDPFAGCATACVAAAIEGRQWVGIELCEAGSDIVQVRLAEADMGELGAVSAKAHICRRPPRRTDLNGDEPRKGTRLYKTRDNIDYLYGRQRGDCAGCKLHFRVQNLTVDHVHPRSQGGPDAVDNLQLLCGSCNSIKGDRDMPYLIKRLAEIEAERQARLDF